MFGLSVLFQRQGCGSRHRARGSVGAAVPPLSAAASRTRHLNFHPAASLSTSRHTPIDAAPNDNEQSANTPSPPLKISNIHNPQHQQTTAICDSLQHASRTRSHRTRPDNHSPQRHPRRHRSPPGPLLGHRRVHRCRLTLRECRPPRRLAHHRPSGL